MVRYSITLLKFGNKVREFHKITRCILQRCSHYFVEDALFYFKLVDFNIVKFHSPFFVLFFFLRVPVDKSDHY